MYQTKSTLPNMFLGDKTKYTKTNLFNQIHQTKLTKLKKSNLPTKMFEMVKTNPSDNYY